METCLYPELLQWKSFLENGNRVQQIKLREDELLRGGNNEDPNENRQSLLQQRSTIVTSLLETRAGRRESFIVKKEVMLSVEVVGPGKLEVG